MKVNILGTEYTIKDQKLEDGTAGEIDHSIKTIYIDTMENAEIEDVARYRQQVIRHEVIHAFLFESGLWTNSNWAMNEEMVDWFAIQFPKMAEVFNKIEFMSK